MSFGMICKVRVIGKKEKFEGYAGETGKRVGGRPGEGGRRGEGRQYGRRAA